MSRIYGTIYRDNIKYINIKGENVVNDGLELIMYRLILLDNQFVFAEEISTGCIFPVGAFYAIDSKKMFKEFSFAGIVNYFVDAYINPIFSNLGEIYIDEERQKKFAYVPTMDEVNAYLAEKQNDIEFQDKIEEYERANRYLCDLEIIDRKIAELCGDKCLNSSYSPVCDISSVSGFGFDLSTQEDLCHAIGREQELEKIIESTVIKGKSILLIGDSGSGKTALIEELARQIKLRTNSWLNNKMIISINANSLIAGTIYRGAFEENMYKLIEFARKNKGKVILFIDEVHTLYSLGTGGKDNSNDAMNILKPYISNRDVVIIGATTTHEYSKYLVPDEAFCSRFDKITIRPLTLEQLIDILREFMEKLQERYGIFYSFSNPQDLLIRVISLTDLKHQVSYNEARVSNIRLAKDVLEDAFVHAKYIGKEVITEKDVLEALTKCERLSSVLRDNLALELNDMVEPTAREPISGTKVIPFMRKLVNPNESK